MDDWQVFCVNNVKQTKYIFKVILCAYEHIFVIVRYRYIGFKQL